MGYFNNFPVSEYFFGDETRSALFQNITTAVDLLDSITDDTAFYETYKILDGERPDTLSYKLYGTVDFYWMFFLLNEKLRTQGWPLTTEEVEEYAKQYYPNLTINTGDAIYGEFYLNDTVAVPNEEALANVEFDIDGNIISPLVFTNLKFKGKILAKRYDMGQLIVKPLREIYKITITNPGSGYTSPPTVTVKGGGGTGAQLEARLATVLNGGVLITQDYLSDIFIVDAGDDFTSNPEIEISLPDLPSGTQAVATAEISRYGLAPGDQLYTIAGIPDPLDWDGADENLRLTQVGNTQFQHLSVHHFEDGNGNQVDLEVTVNGGVFGYGSAVEDLTPITYLDRLQKQNDDLSVIKVLKPDVAQQLNVEFQKLLRRS